MAHIKSLRIEGFKKFQHLTVDFNQDMNILVGENESGKSTILDAIKIVLNQQYQNTDKSILEDLFNLQQVKKFQDNPKIETLPHICIEVEIEPDAATPDQSYFYGENYGGPGSKESKHGIRFECKHNEENIHDVDLFVRQKIIPYEYYTYKWRTFANQTYYLTKNPLRLLFIDTTKDTSGQTFNSYNRILFANRYDVNIKANAKEGVRTKLKKAFDEINLEDLGDGRRFGIDSKKVILESILSIYKDSISLENYGKGMENLIKTEIALNKKNELDVVLMEEPETHLSFTTLQKMLRGISKKREKSQLIVTTHSSMIASRLGLQNILWIKDNASVATSLKNIPKDTADFFMRLDNNSFLQLLLSRKVFLVEGRSEFLLLPKFYKQYTGKNIEEDGITIISCNGISYKRYLVAMKGTNKRIAVLTDNDKKEKKIKESEEFNTSENIQHIFMSKIIDEWTWEICIYNANKENSVLQTIVNKSHREKVSTDTEILEIMLNNKTDIAYEMAISNDEFAIPQHIQEAIKWLIEK